MSTDKILAVPVLNESLVPELGIRKKGKVRDIYFKDDNVVMIATDRVSAFDHQIPNLIPYKGLLLNRITEHAFKSTADIVPNALISSPDPNVVVQKKVENLGVEFIIRGYVWGSLAASYEKGNRTICGISLPEGLRRYQKLDTPLYTPTTKATEGPDEDMTEAEVEKKIGKELAAKVKDLAFKLYARGNEIASKAKKPLILIDTKYEFGLDSEGNLLLIDEVNTPDSSRLCEVSEWEEKWAKIVAASEELKEANVSKVLAVKPELKIKEFSKQYVRDVLLESGFKPGKEVPKLTQEQVVEATKRYIEVYENITHETFEYPISEISSESRLVKNLAKAGIIKGYVALIFAGSSSDIDHMKKLESELAKFGIPAKLRVCSAHKQPAKLEETVAYYNNSIEPVVIVGCAGGTDALSGTASYSSVFPIVSCPPDGKNDSCLNNPPGSSNSYIWKPSNVAKHVAQIFSIHNPALRDELKASAVKKVKVLEEADAKLQATGSL